MRGVDDATVLDGLWSSTATQVKTGHVAGGGMRYDTASLTISNMNLPQQPRWGLVGGILNNSMINPLVTNFIFVNNLLDRDMRLYDYFTGGGMPTGNGSSPTLVNVLFRDKPPVTAAAG